MSSKLEGPDVSFVDMLDLRLYDRSIEEDKDVKKFFPLRPSSSGDCTRVLAYRLAEYLGTLEPVAKEPKEGNVMRLLSFGHALEPDVIKHFKQNCGDLFKVRYEQQAVSAFRVNDSTGTFPELKNRLIEGSMDFAFWSDEYRAIIDLKSKKVKFSKWFSDNWSEIDELIEGSKVAEPIGTGGTGWWITNIRKFIKYLHVKDPFFAKNFHQLNLYGCSDFAKSRAIDFCSILQYDKNASRMREIRFKPSDALLRRTKQKFQAAVDAVTKEGEFDKYAKRDFAYGSIVCAFCSHKDECWREEEQDAKQAFFDTLSPYNKNWPKDVGRLSNKDAAAKLESLYQTYMAAEEARNEGIQAEREIISIMKELRIWKIRFSDKRIYKRKELSKGEVLRRVKL